MVKPVVRGREEGLESGRPQSREDFLRRRMLLLPELVLQHRIPGPVWRELQVFPFVVHRLQKIIRASELAGQVNAGISMNLKETTCLPDEPLNFEFHAGINLFKKLVRNCSCTIYMENYVLPPLIYVHVYCSSPSTPRRSVLRPQGRI